MGGTPNPGEVQNLSPSKRRKIMPGAKDEYDKGYADGRREAEYQKSHGVIDRLIRDFGYSPMKSDSEAYKGGFKQGVEDGHKK
ncbi:MAG: hypothetical protein ACOZAL_00310 [Patescibacteria group bacterium]